MVVSSSEAAIWSVEKDFFLQIVKCERRVKLMERFNIRDTIVPFERSLLCMGHWHWRISGRKTHGALNDNGEVCFEAR